MLRLILAAIAVVALAAPVPHAYAQGAMMGRTAGLLRTTLIVEDIDKSVDFYQRVGLTKVSDISGTDSTPDGIYGAADLPLTADPKSSRVVTLRSGDTGAFVVLLWYDRPPLPIARGNLVGLGIGDVIIGIEVPDIEAAYSRLSQIGTRFQRQPARFSQPGEGPAALSGQHMLAYDPDGHMVEVIQPDRAPRP
jgi:catechol 2,3-dioxygenase-like lactoylglutathione lyase family enzyme